MNFVAQSSLTCSIGTVEAVEAAEVVAVRLLPVRAACAGAVAAIAASTKHLEIVFIEAPLETAFALNFILFPAAAQ
jgi:hypothetical protein